MKLRKLVAIMMMLMLLCTGALAEEQTDGLDTNPPVTDGIDAVETTDAKEHTTGEGTEYLPEPTVRLEFSFEGDVLTEGTKVTIRAIVENVPDSATYRLQWQNDMTGAFADVPNETGEKIEFSATAENTACYWRALLFVEVAANDAETADAIA